MNSSINLDVILNQQLPALLLDYFKLNFFAINKEGVYLIQNSTLAGVVGGELKAETVDEKSWRSCQEVMRTRKRQVVEEEYQGQWFLSVKIPIIQNDEVTGVMGISLDITERKKMEEELRKAKETAEAANRAKTMFLANMSHDIKTPIAGIISTAEHLTHAIEDEEYKSRADDIVQSGLRLLELMIEIIEVSRLEVKQAETRETRFKLSQLINDIVQLIKPALVDKPVELKIHYDETIPKFLVGDRWHLYRIILNLVSNAIKFTKEGAITLDVELIKETKKEIFVKIEVEDTGIGIPEDKQTTIFKEFSRLKPSYEGVYQGTGLGLYIVKQFVKAMRGTVTVASKEGEGSTFTVIVPLKKTDRQDDDQADQKPSDTKITSIAKNNKPVTKARIKKISTDEAKTRIKVLLVEDDAIAARAAKDLLAALGCEVEHAATGYDALRFFEKDKYQLIFMDLGLPDKDGLQIVRWIRNLETESLKTPIIALSAHVDEKIKASCLEAGMNIVLMKPLMREQAKQVISSQLGKSYIAEFSSQKRDQSYHHEADSNKIIDLEKGAAIISSDVKAAKKAIDLLMEVLPQTQKDLHRAFECGDFDSMSESVHKFRGGVAYCGVPRLQRAVQALEIGLKSGDLQQIKELYQNLSAEIKAFVEAYRSLEIS